MGCCAMAAGTVGRSTGCRRRCSRSGTTWIENDDGDRVFKVDGKALRVRDTFVLEDASGRVAAHPRHDTEIERGGKTSNT